ncbi:MAG: hypothetical protein IAG10_03835 [Planctomycetaceae bacterium]|nr:hypothetical protein [Planctomycetaceae bacterium]
MSHLLEKRFAGQSMRQMTALFPAECRGPMTVSRCTVFQAVKTKRYHGCRRTAAG